MTTLGPMTADDLGMILPHEHVFVDLRTWDQPGYAEADPAAVVALMAPEVERARDAGVTAIVECSTVGVGRRADIDRAVSEATGFPLVVPTGIYREPWVPRWAHEASEDELFEWMLRELTDEIEGTGVRAGWIKLSAGDDGMTACETKILRAAARAAKATGSVIGSHTIRGRVVRDQLDILDEVGLSAGPVHLDPHAGRAGGRDSTSRSPGAAPGSNTTRSATTTSPTPSSSSGSGVSSMQVSAVGCC